MLINKIFVVCKDMKFHHFSQEKYGRKTDNSGKINRNSLVFAPNCHKNITLQPQIGICGYELIWS